MHIKLRDITNPFKKKMDNGAIYLEYSDNYKIALHRSLYTCEGSNPEMNSIYTQFIDKLNTDNRVRRLIKFYYKVENLDENDGAGSENVWIDMLQVGKNTPGNIYRYAYNYRNTANLQINVKSIKSVQFTDRLYHVYTIDHYDGTIHDSENICPLNKIYTRDKRYITISKYNIENPLSTKEHLKDDIKIELKDSPILQYNNTVKDTLVWLNGRFVETSTIEENDKVMFISKGMSSVNNQHVGFIGADPLVLKHNDGYQVASYEQTPSRNQFGPDFDICIFKWDNVTISKWNKPFQYKYDTLNYVDDLVTGSGLNDYTFSLKYIREIAFSKTIPESHFILYNGAIIDKDDYDIEGSSIIFKTMRSTVNSVITDTVAEYGKTPIVPHITTKFLPKPEDFRLVILSHSNPLKTIKLNRSSICHKNHPFSFHITFPKLNVGDMVLLDGIYERYLIHDQNCIRYPFTEYMARYEHRNVLSETKVMRIWINFD